MLAAIGHMLAGPPNWHWLSKFNNCNTSTVLLLRSKKTEKKQTIADKTRQTKTDRHRRKPTEVGTPQLKDDNGHKHGTPQREKPTEDGYIIWRFSQVATKSARRLVRSLSSHGLVFC